MLILGLPGHAIGCLACENKARFPARFWKTRLAIISVENPNGGETGGIAVRVSLIYHPRVSLISCKHGHAEVNGEAPAGELAPNVQAASYIIVYECLTIAL